jgi:poly(hydroxyalkanoate) depolymerase family esterase
MAYISWRGAAVVTACAALAATALGAAGGAAEASTGSVTTGSYTNAAGTLAYQVYVPAAYKPGVAMPLVVALHGCTESADQFRTLTRFDDVADAKGFIVVYPEQSKSANQLGCWDWFQQAHLNRGAGEPSLIAGITAAIQQHYTVDPHRTYVAGFSAGGAMAEVMAATYPDVYAAIGVGSGCEYTAGAACAGYQSADANQAAQRAYQAMGTHARQVPFVVFQGDQDTTVPPVNAQQLVQAGLVISDLADDGAANGSVPSAPTRAVDGQVPGGQSYTVQYYSNGHGAELAQFWMVHGMGHAWSGGDASMSFSDPSGPGASAAMYDFFASHPAP